MEGFGGNRRFGGGGNRGGSGGGFRRNNFSGPREMHKATCSECKNECEVPFKPAEGKPVYCRDCYMKKKQSDFRQDFNQAA
jgi:CxxC-x17-CxxC domain-containing protein